MIGISKPADTERFNTETATDPLVSYVISFEALGQRFRIELKIPLYIDGKMKAEDWDIAEKAIKARAEELRRSAALGGTLFDLAARWQVAAHVTAFAKQAIYNQFMKYQVREGNHEGHEVPRSLQ